MKKLIVICFVVTGMIFFMTGCKENRAETIEATGKIDTAFLENVKTVKAGFSNQIQEISLTGKIDYDPDKIVNYVPLVNGVVERTYFSTGDKVQKGQKLIDFRSTELSSLYSDFVILEAEVKVAEREMERVRSLYEDNMLSEKEYFEAQSKLRQTQASLQKTRTDMAVFDINDESGTFSIKSPMTGYIVEKNVASGSTISSGSEPLFIVADLSTIWVIANIYAGDLGFVHEGMEASFTILSYPGETFHGKINNISQVFDPEEKTLKARIIMKNDEFKFKPEMTTLVKLKNENNIKLISIPDDAVIFDNNKYYVVIETSSGNFDIRGINIHGHSKGNTYVLSGIDENENIVIKNQLLIYAGLNNKM